MTVITYLVQVFSMGSLENSLTALGAFYYGGHILLAVLYALLEVFPGPKKDKQKDKPKST